ncbi:glycosyltransferase family 4 protein [Qipengyuania soli]|uniref:Glycosyltransferase family 4 protein n=1 Tax=Qipengyuania soli TaxID=2782568 RepID=A0A7S8F6T3_9SPHN|nr:glycosyltransferase family 4 protein [Qipengyuania soli]QPD00305.1 glycosyltransferase family 4 protein [Qipengyuania soli]
MSAASKDKLTVLAVHNRYQLAGGEDRVFEDETTLLEKAGHQVHRLQLSNDDIVGLGGKLANGLGATYSFRGRKLVSDAILSCRPDVVHVHNFFPKFSPAIFDATREHSVASVLTLHNFRIACANGTLFRDGTYCDQCVGQSPLPAIVHRCYRGSRTGSAAIAAMIQTHKALGTWQNKVDRFIILTEAARTIFEKAGVPSNRMVAKANPVSIHATTPASPAERSHFVYAGRLSPEKGVGFLVQTWRERQEPLLIIGDGPDRQMLESIAPPNVTFLGHLDHQAMLSNIGRARALIVPSLCPEMFGLVAVEAMATGTPVIAARIGGLTKIVTDSQTGFLFDPGNGRELCAAIDSLSDDDLLSRMIGQSLSRYQEEFAPEHTMEVLEQVYRGAISDARQRAGKLDPGRTGS